MAEARLEAHRLVVNSRPAARACWIRPLLPIERVAKPRWKREARRGSRRVGDPPAARPGGAKLAALLRQLLRSRRVLGDADAGAARSRTPAQFRPRDIAVDDAGAVASRLDADFAAQMSDDDDFACCVTRRAFCAGDCVRAPATRRSSSAWRAPTAPTRATPPRCSRTRGLISAGHALLDDDGALHTNEAAALEAVRAFTMLCRCLRGYMDVTGGRERDCSRWLTAPSRPKSAGPPPGWTRRRPPCSSSAPAWAATGGVALVSATGFGAALTRYTATDVEGRVSAIRARVAERGLGHVLRASTLWWGAAVETEYDLVVVCETLHWKGDLPDDEDTIVPLARTARQRVRRPAHGRPPRPSRAQIFSARETRFFELCRARDARCTSERAADGAAALASRRRRRSSSTADRAARCGSWSCATPRGAERGQICGTLKLVTRST